ncbi:MAG: Ig-like domain-containing protein [Steroidobacteraceae bacterium]
MNIITPVRFATLALLSALLVACGGGSSSSRGGGGGGGGTPPNPPGPPATYTIGGSVSGLASGATVVLQNNGGSDLTITANGSFRFPGSVNSGTSYAVTVLTQPSTPAQVCSVSAGSGAATGNVSNIVVTCATTLYTVGGTVSGLASGASVVLQNNGGMDLTVGANGSFTFPTGVPSGSAFAVTVLTQPSSPPQTCTVSGGSGTVGAANVNSVMVDCATDAYTVGGTIAGLASGATVVLQGGAGLGTQTVTSNGSFAFGMAVPSGTAYTVSVLTQPAAPLQNCVVSANGSGTVASADVTNIQVNCTSLYTIGGTVTGLAAGGTVVLQNNAGDDLSVAADGAFTFATPLAGGAAYAVTVLTQPTVPGPGQTCVVAMGAGTVGAADVTSVTVTCSNNDQTAPTITARSPLPTAVGSPVQGAVVSVTFSEAIETSTVNSSSFSVQGPSGPVAGTINFADGNTRAIFTPTATIAYDADYTVTVTTAVRDPSGNPLAANSVWAFNSGKKIAAGAYRHTCVRTDDGRVKCWGHNDAGVQGAGMLGYDDTTNRGDAMNPLLGALPDVNLGAGRTAVALAAGDYHTCVILDNGDTKCWGSNLVGELGQPYPGTGSSVGDQAGEMALLQPLDFGAGRRALEIVLGQRFGCARLDDDTLKCWGRNDSGELGQDNTTALGVVAGDLAAAPPIALGAGLRPVSMGLGHYHVCALLEDGAGVRSVKCWGNNQWGQLGLGHQNNRGDSAGEMAGLPLLDFGTGRTPVKLAVSAGHSCVVLDNDAIKCWGLNTWGQVGLNAGNNGGAGMGLLNRTVCWNHPTDCIGDAGGEMGDSLQAAITAPSTRLALGYRFSCAQLATGELKCWGTNEHGQMGIGDNSGNNEDIGDQTGEMAALANTQLKPGTTVEELTAIGFHSCVWTEQDTLNCWGMNNFGQLGRNDTNNWGDEAGEMGVNLHDVDFGP